MYKNISSINPYRIFDYCDTVCTIDDMMQEPHDAKKTRWYDRVKRRLKELDLTQDVLVEPLKVSRSAVGHYMTGRREPSIAQFKAIADLLGWTIEELLEGEDKPWTYTTPPPNAVIEGGGPTYFVGSTKELKRLGYTFVPIYDVELSAGNGAINGDYVEEIGKYPVPPDVMRRYNLNPDKTATVFAKGSSMETTIANGDALVVDLRQQSVIDGKIYAINNNGQTKVKRLFRQTNGDLILHSDNTSRYREETISAEDENQHISIIGLVVYKSGSVV